MRKRSPETDSINAGLQDVAKTGDKDCADKHAWQEQSGDGKVDLVVLQDELVEFKPV